MEELEKKLELLTHLHTERERERERERVSQFVYLASYLSFIPDLAWDLLNIIFISWQHQYFSLDQFIDWKFLTIKKLIGSMLQEPRLKTNGAWNLERTPHHSHSLTNQVHKHNIIHHALHCAGVRGLVHHALHRARVRGCQYFRKAPVPCMLHVVMLMYKLRRACSSNLKFAFLYGFIPLYLFAIFCSILATC